MTSANTQQCRRYVVSGNRRRLTADVCLFFHFQLHFFEFQNTHTHTHRIELMNQLNAVEIQ